MELLPFQHECVNEIERFAGRSLLAVDMGCGKTLIALTWLDRHPGAFPAVVICPAAVKYHWEREALGVGVRASVLEGQTPSRNGWAGSQPKLVVVNYDILDHWLGWLKKLKPRTIICDECQMTMSPRAIRSKATRALCRGVPHVLALSGTPLVNRPIELFTTLNIIRPDVWKNRWSYGHRFCGPKWTPWGYKFQGASHTSELNESLLSTCMIRRRKADVLPELPTKVREVIPIPMSDPAEYRRAKDDFLNWLRRQDPVKAQRASHAQTLVKIGCLKRLAARLKLRYVVEWIERFLENTDEKLVVFAVHRKMIEALQRRCPAKSLVIDGTVTGRKRAAVVDRFQRDSEVRVLIGNIQAAGVGITLTAANNVVFAELPWRPGDCTQAEDRCHRIGTTQTVWVTYLVAHDTIEELLCELIQHKQGMLSATLDGGPTEGDIDLFTQLMRMLEKGER